MRGCGIDKSTLYKAFVEEIATLGAAYADQTK